MRREILVAVALALLGGAVEGCSGNASTSPAMSSLAHPTSITLPLRDQAARYLQAVGPANEALHVWKGLALSGLGDQPSLPGASSQLASALDRADASLTKTGFTGSAASDIAALVSANSKFAEDLRRVSAEHLHTWTFSLLAHLAADAKTITRAASAARRDLGLPAPTPA